jgi:hypothetical protein
MKSLSPLACHRVTAETPIPASRAFLLLILIFLLINEALLRLSRLLVRFQLFPENPHPACQHVRSPDIELYRAISSYVELSRPISTKIFFATRGCYSRFTLPTAAHGSLPEACASFLPLVSAFSLSRLPLFGFADPHSAQHFKPFQTCSTQNSHQPFGPPQRIFSQFTFHVSRFEAAFRVSALSLSAFPEGDRSLTF